VNKRLTHRFRKVTDFIKPPGNWSLPVSIISGLFLGLIIYVLYLSKAFSYLSDNPKVCMNCHVMAPQYATWSHSSHRIISNCNDCHVPQNNIISHYLFKAKDGLRHSFMFTFRLEPQVIIIKKAGLNVVQENCKRCHQKLTEQTCLFKVTGRNYEKGEGKLCWECHREVPHGRSGSLSSVPFSRVPYVESPVPTWLKKIMK
jgi:cytochrome c nitrite reductase small subunit